MVAKAKRELSKHSENKWVLLAVLGLAQFMVVLDVAIVNVGGDCIYTNFWRFLAAWWTRR
jgi:hypothetical protein